jgi:pseudouridine synthase
MSEGRVRVNGRVVTEPGTTVIPSRDQVEVDGVTVEHDGALLYLMLFKPPGVITSLSDPEGRPIITDLLPEQARRAWPVGRLDWDSEGLLIVTNDGRLTWLLTHPSREMDKTYHVKVRGMIPRQDAGLRHMRRGGIALPDGHVTDPTEVAHLGDTGRHPWFQIVLHEGRNREIRNMCEAVGYQVLRLRRVAIGPVELGELDTGMWRSMSASEVTSLYRAAGDEAPRD